MEAIDIPFDRLCQWLTERRRLAKDWTGRLAGLQTRLASELDALPPLPALALFRDADFVGFLDLDEIIGIMVKNEEGRGQAVKSLFGRFNNPQIRLWDNIRSEYRKNHLFLAEYGQRLIQVVKYDIRSLKAEAVALSRSIEDHNRQAGEKEKHAIAAKTRYEKLCKEYEIDSALPPKPQLAAQVCRLQQLFNDVLVHLQKPIVRECLALHGEFLSFLYDAGECSETQKIAPKLNSLKSLSQLVELPAAITPAESISLSAVDEVVELPCDDSAWDITSVDENEKVAESSPILSLLESRLRLGVRTDLIELEYFLTQRCAELNHDTRIDVLAGDVQGNVLPYLGRDLSWAKNARQHIIVAKAMLDSDQIQRLLQIRASPAYLDRLVASFEVPRSLERKCQEKAAGLRERADELRKGVIRLQEQIEKKTSLARILKERAETDLEALYSGKSIKLIGEIGNILRKKK